MHWDYATLVVKTWHRAPGIPRQSGLQLVEGAHSPVREVEHG